jgi:hypothetical protein
LREDIYSAPSDPSKSKPSDIKSWSFIFSLKKFITALRMSLAVIIPTICPFSDVNNRQSLEYRGVGDNIKPDKDIKNGKTYPNSSNNSVENSNKATINATKNTHVLGRLSPIPSEPSFLHRQNNEVTMAKARANAKDKREEEKPSQPQSQPLKENTIWS